MNRKAMNYKVYDTNIFFDSPKCLISPYPIWLEGRKNRLLKSPMEQTRFIHIFTDDKLRIRVTRQLSDIVCIQIQEGWF